MHFPLPLHYGRDATPSPPGPGSPQNADLLGQGKDLREVGEWLGRARPEGGLFVGPVLGVELDLRQASIRDSPAVIHAFTLWGGIDLKVPPEWNLEYRLLPLLGGYSDETSQSPGPDSPTLVIKGAAIMAGVDVKN